MVTIVSREEQLKLLAGVRPNSKIVKMTRKGRGSKAAPRKIAEDEKELNTATFKTVRAIALALIK